MKELNLKKELKLIILFVLMFLSSCNYDPSYKDENDFYAWKDEYAPLIEKELAIIDSVRDIGFTMTINRPFIGRNGYRESTYSVKIASDTFYVSQSNYSTLVQLRKGIVQRLCKEIIADSVLYDTKDISFVYTLPDNKNGKHYNSGVKSDSFFPIETYPVNSLLNAYGFKIVKTSSGIYKREKL
ncbi:hypothetical protein D3C87_84770 [compost metagenome]